jgi:hypothetical protein
MAFGQIAIACKKSLSKNMDEAMKMTCQGIMDSNLRVRYSALTSTGILLAVLAPTV